MEINELLTSNKSDEEKISYLKSSKNITLPPIELLMQEYDPMKHRVHNQIDRPDKVRANQKVDKVSRIHLALQQLVVRRMTEFMFAIPVKRVYHGQDKSDLHKEAAQAIEAVYMRNRIDTRNLERARQLFAGCETATLWYTRESKNKDYGFESTKKLVCKTYSPMDGYRLYPFFDESDDLVAMSIEYSTLKSDTTRDYFFETYTADRHLRWKSSQSDSTRTLEVDEENKLGKIPFVYMHRKRPIWEYTSTIVDEIEMTLSRNSDVIAYNSAPILTVSGTLVGAENKGEERRVYKMENGGNVQYVSWNQATDSVKMQIDTLLKLFWLQLQLPDLSLDNLRGITPSGEALKTLLIDSQLKVGDEQGVFLEGFDREFNLVKKLVCKLNPAYNEVIDDITAEHIIKPYEIHNEKDEIQNLLLMNGDKPLMSQRESIEMLDWTTDVDKTLSQIQAEQAQALAASGLGM